jgi:hypothetical protein
VTQRSRDRRKSLDQRSHSGKMAPRSASSRALPGILTDARPDRTPIKLDGSAFPRVVESYAPNEVLQLTAYPARLDIKSSRSSFSMGRPGREAITAQPIPRDKRHKGPVKISDQPIQERVELDATWDFSARMPVPHQQFPDSQIPKEADPRPRSRPEREK